MREPQLEDFMAELEAKDFSLVQLLVYGNKRNKQSEDLAYEKITQTLWFLDESRAETVADGCYVPFVQHLLGIVQGCRQGDGTEDCHL